MAYSNGPYTHVTSSNIASVAWSDGSLYVVFHHGGEYRYRDVPRKVFEQMLSAPSVGKFFHAEVRNKYPHERVESGSQETA